MGLLRWIVEVLVLTIVANLVIRLFAGRPTVRAGGPRASRGGPRPTPDSPGRERAGGALVRDPQCGTYVPQSRAICVGSGGNVQYFCSEGCRAAYAAAHPQ